MVTFKEFKELCEQVENENRMWNIQTAVLCTNIREIMKETVFWKRKKMWRILCRTFDIGVIVDKLKY